MAGVPVERYDVVAVALRRLGRSWWLWLILGSVTVSSGGRELLPFLVVRQVVLGAYVVFSLVRLADAVPEPSASRLRGLAVLATLGVLIDASGGLVTGWVAPASSASTTVGIVGLLLFARTMRRFTRNERRTANVVATWEQATRWGVLAVGLLAAATVVALPVLALSSGSHAAHGVRDVAGALAVLGILSAIGAILLTARGTSWTRMAFGTESDRLLHGPTVPGPQPDPG